jgi:hypothetical protein
VPEAGLRDRADLDDGSARSRSLPACGTEAHQLTVDLGAVREWQVRHLVAEEVQAIDLVVDHGLFLIVERFDELSDGLGAVRIAVVDGLEVA